MMPELTLSGYAPMLLSASSLRKFRGTRLAGSEYWLGERDGIVAHFFEYQQPHFSISYRLLNAAGNIPPITIKERPGTLRIEVILEGSILINEKNGTLKQEAGQYRITDEDQTRFSFSSGTYAVKHLIAHFDKAIIEQDNTLFTALTNQTFLLSSSMNKLLAELLHNRYQPALLPFYYENCVRELFFLHAFQQSKLQPSKLSSQELTAVHEADRIIRENLHVHFSIRELARKTGTNEYKLKKDFRTVFDIGLFGRLLELRMQYAKQLLQTTPMSIKDIAEKAGYDTVAGFITAFRKYYGSPPGEWRSDNSKEDTPESRLE